MLIKAMGRMKMKELDWVRRLWMCFQLSEEQKTITVRTSFSDADKTLSGDFIRDAEDKVVETLKKAGFPLKMG